MVEFQVMVKEILSLFKVVPCLMMSERYVKGPLSKALPVIEISHQLWKRIISLNT